MFVKHNIRKSLKAFAEKGFSFVSEHKLRQNADRENRFGYNYYHRGDYLIQLNNKKK